MAADHHYISPQGLPAHAAGLEATIARGDPPRELELQAEGDLAGPGRRELQQQGEVTTVRYLWDVQTTRPWMNLVAPSPGRCSPGTAEA